MEGCLVGGSGALGEGRSDEEEQYEMEHGSLEYYYWVP